MQFLLGMFALMHNLRAVFLNSSSLYTGQRREKRSPEPEPEPESQPFYRYGTFCTKICCTLSAIPRCRKMLGLNLKDAFKWLLTAWLHLIHSHSFPYPVHFWYLIYLTTSHPVRLHLTHRGYIIHKDFPSLAEALLLIHCGYTFRSLSLFHVHEDINLSNKAAYFFWMKAESHPLRLYFIHWGRISPTEAVSRPLRLYLIH